MKKRYYMGVWTCLLILGTTLFATIFIKEEYVRNIIEANLGVSLGINFLKDSGKLNNSFFWFMFAVTFGYVLWRIIKEEKLLRELNSALKFISDKNQEDYEVIDSEFTGRKYGDLKNIWEYYKSSISTEEVNGKKIYRQQEDAEEFYNPDVLLHEKINTRILKYIPQLLVGVGLLGTFWGLSLGLSKLDLANTADISQINKLIGGVKTSFYTSLYGIYFSVIFTINVSIFLGLIEAKIGELKTKLNLIFYYNGNDLIERLRENVETIRNATDGMAERITDSIEEGIGKQQQELLEFVQGSVKMMADGLSDSFEETIKTSLETIFTTDFIEKFKNIKDELIGVSEQNNKFIESYKKELVEVTSLYKEFKEDYSAAHQELSKEFKELKDSLKEESVKFNEIFNNSMTMYSKLDNFYSENKNILEENKELIDKLEVTATQLERFGSTQENISKIWKEYGSVFSNLEEVITKSNDEYIALLKDSDEKYGKMIETRTAEYTNNIYNGTQKLFKEYEDNLVSVIDKFNGVLKNFSKELTRRQHTLNIVEDLLEDNKRNIGESKKMLEEIKTKEQEVKTYEAPVVEDVIDEKIDISDELDWL